LKSLPIPARLRVLEHLRGAYEDEAGIEAQLVLDWPVTDQQPQAATSA